MSTRYRLSADIAAGEVLRDSCGRLIDEIDVRDAVVDALTQVVSPRSSKVCLFSA